MVSRDLELFGQSRIYGDFSFTKEILVFSGLLKIVGFVIKVYFFVRQTDLKNNQQLHF
jgi:hypothetical protein